MEKEQLRMQLLAGIITENQYQNELKGGVDPELVEKYHSILMEIDGYELAGDLDEMLEYSKDFSSFKEFLDNEFEVLDDVETVETIKKELADSGMEY